MKLIVFGGNGYVGQRIIASALKMGVEIVSISRSGSPNSSSVGMKTLNSILANAPSTASITWAKGDIFQPDEWKSHLHQAVGAISCIGAFGSNEFMEKINGDANCLAVSECLRENVPKFVFLSTVENNLPDVILKGYFNGKRRAENAVLDAYPDTGTVLRPSFIYGCREVGNISIPLGPVGKLLETVFQLPGINMLKSTIPGGRAIFATPVSVENVGLVAAASVIAPEVLELDSIDGDITPYKFTGILSEDDINNLAKKLTTDSIEEYISSKITTIPSQAEYETKK